MIPQSMITFSTHSELTPGTLHTLGVTCTMLQVVFKLNPFHS